MATNEQNKIATSQIALPKDVCDQVYATDGYGQSVQNTEPGVARRPTWSSPMTAACTSSGTMSGSVADGLAVALVVPVGA